MSFHFVSIPRFYDDSDTHSLAQSGSSFPFKCPSHFHGKSSFHIFVTKKPFHLESLEDLQLELTLYKLSDNDLEPVHRRLFPHQRLAPGHAPPGQQAHQVPDQHERYAEVDHGRMLTQVRIEAHEVVVAAARAAREERELGAGEGEVAVDQEVDRGGHGRDGAHGEGDGVPEIKAAESGSGRVEGQPVDLRENDSIPFNRCCGSYLFKFNKTSDAFRGKTVMQSWGGSNQQSKST